MNKSTLPCLLAVMAHFLAACASPKICTREIRQSDPKAVALLAASKRAHGSAAFARIHDLSVSYDGRWAAVGPRFQPVLADTKFRRTSEERLIVGPRIMAQQHSGPGGRKIVVRNPGNVAVTYNGTPSDDAEVRRAAALVADAYSLFLLGPFFFDRPGIVLAPNSDSVVGKASCDEILAVLRPGFGEASEDRVILSIDRSSKLLRRVRMTLNGLGSTRGAEVDVTFRDFRTINGIVWPTDFDERIRVPFDLHAHQWKVRGLEVNRGFRAEDLSTNGFKGRAAAPTSQLGFPAR